MRDVSSVGHSPQSAVLRVGAKRSDGGRKAVAGVVAAEFHVFCPFLPEPAVLFFTAATADKTDGAGERTERRTPEGGRVRVGGALSAKGDLCLARKRRYSKHPPEPRSGVHPKESGVGNARSLCWS